jgi:23S rRNA-/tRNA-specific pseudouridylate synthase
MGIALHAHLLEIAHPVTKEATRFTAPLPKSLARLVNVESE